jgi:hypothetical protein
MTIFKVVDLKVIGSLLRIFKLCHCGTEAAIDGRQAKRQGCIPVKLYLQEQATGPQEIVFETLM